MKKILLIIMMLWSLFAYSQNTCSGTYTFGTGSCQRIIIGNGTPGQITVCLDVNAITSGGGTSCNPGGSCDPPYGGGGWAPRISIFNSNAAGTTYSGGVLATWTAATGQTCYTVSAATGYAVLFGLCGINGTQISWSTVNSCGLNICGGAIDCPTTGNNNFIANALEIDQCNTAFNTSNAGATNAYSASNSGCGGVNLNNLDCNNSTAPSGGTGADVTWSIENDIWYTFCPLATGTWNISLTGTNCSNPGGYQLGVFQGTPNNLATRHYVSPCTQTQGLSCVRSLTGTTNISFNVTSTTNCIYIVIDGHAGAVCNFSMSVTADNCILPMPIELLSFTVENIRGENILNWVTASEKDNNYFTLEYSSDGYNWEILDKIKGGGTSYSSLMYEYIHKDYKPGFNYYRLKQTDYDGKSTHHDVVGINNSSEDFQIYKIFDIQGREVDINSSGIKYIFYQNGTIKKINK